MLVNEQEAMGDWFPDATTLRRRVAAVRRAAEK
jgi:hypothetical protein